MIVHKYGGVTVDSPEKIKRTALRIQSTLISAKKMIVVVSAMGSTTNDLIVLAQKISNKPNLRELDMLLTTGERISASLMTMALLDLGIKATSLTGSQAGIVTTENHSNAYITDIRPQRIIDLLKIYDVIVIAGFQGVSLVTKNITTLGRGGSDTTAIALAAVLKAESCYILKEVPGIFTTDPKLTSNATHLPNLSLKQASSLTFWGAKVLHHRSVKLAEKYKVPVYVGPANNQLAHGTWIREDVPTMFESPTFYAISSHPRVFEVRSKETCSIAEALNKLHSYLKHIQIAEPQILFSQQIENQSTFYLTASTEALDLLEKSIIEFPDWDMISSNLSSVSVQCYPTTSMELQSQLLLNLESLKVHVHCVLYSPDAITLIVPDNISKDFIQHLHDSLIESSSSTG